MFKLGVALVLVVEVVGLLLLTLVVEDFPVWILIPLVPLTVGIALVVRRELEGPAHRLRRLSPEAIVGFRPRRRAESPETLSRSIVERACQDRRSPPEPPPHAARARA